MDWIRTHPYTSSLAGAGVLIIIGGIFVFNSAVTPAPIGVSTWSGNPGTIINPNSSGAAPTNANNTATVPTATQNYATSTTLPYKSATSVSTSSGTADDSGDSSYDLDTLLAQISQSGKSTSKASSTSPGASGSVNAWAYIPSSMIATTSPTPSRTASQQALYTYGNEIGSYVEGYDAGHTNQAQILQDANNDRHNTAKQAAVEQIGKDLETIGEGIGQTTDTPASAVGANTALSNSYIEIGKDLVAVGQAEGSSDDALVAAIKTYDAAVDKFNKSYVALATIFIENGVTFSAGDPGSVFTFNSSSNSL